jgi:hypothetical protein
MTYELIYAPEQARYQSMSRAAELEQRIAAMERRLGSTSLSAVGTLKVGGCQLPPLDFMPGVGAGNFLEVEDATVGNAVLALSARVDALSESNLSDLESRLSGVQSSLSAVGRMNASSF